MTRPLTPAEMEKLAAGRASLLRMRPYFASAALALEPLATEGLGTFAVDARWHLYLDPPLLDRWSAAEIGVVLEHELNHLLRDHHGRASALGVAPHERFHWNVACDAAINDDLCAEGRQLPDSPVVPADIGMDPYLPEERYFNALARSGSPTGQWSSFQLDCGSAVHGLPRPYEVDEGGLGVAEIREVRRLTSSAIRCAGASASLSWRRWADSHNPPRTRSWESILAESMLSLLSTCSGDRRSFRRLSRRASDPTVISKGRLRTLPRVGVAVDTSGSMSAASLGIVTAELRSLEHAGVADESVVIVCDDQIRSIEPLTLFSERNLRGGGGTDMRVALHAAENRNLDAAVVFTDGYTPWPASPPALQVLVILVASSRAARSTVPTWARAIDICSIASDQPHHLNPTTRG